MITSLLLWSDSSVSVSDRSLKVKSATDNTAALDVQNSGGTTKFLVDTSYIEQRFLLGDSRADTSTLTVKVQNSASDSTTTTYTKATDITQLSSTSTYYDSFSN